MRGLLLYPLYILYIFLFFKDKGVCKYIKREGIVLSPLSFPGQPPASRAGLGWQGERVSGKVLSAVLSFWTQTLSPWPDPGWPAARPVRPGLAGLVY